MKKMLALPLAVAVFAAPFSAFAAANSNCMVYEPGVVTVKGKVRHAAEWVIEVAKPFCIEGRENDKTGLYSTVDEVLTVVIATKKGSPASNYQDYQNKDVTAVGTLYRKSQDAVLGQQVVMMVSQITPDAAAAPAEKSAK